MNFFENSHHLTKKGTSGEQGAGLGMILAKEFIDIHKGRIYVKSEENKGAVFGFSIPQ